MFSLICDSTNDAVVIDPSFHDRSEFQSLETHLEGKNVKHILLTHGHADHVAGVADAARKWPDATIHLHPLEEENYNLAQAHGKNFGIEVPKLPPPTDEIEDGDILKVGENIQLEFLHTPGHAPGHVAFVDDRSSDGAVIIGGDLLFRGSVGRTDFFNSSTDDLLASLRRLYEELDDESIVLSGHTTPTYLKNERATNPFVAHALSLPEEWYQDHSSSMHFNSEASTAGRVLKTLPSQ
jgi:glyoxylase-like metal-dependent hydrolase (beta-lactamase superfamily II)